MSQVTRTSVSLETPLYEAALEAAMKEKRTFSNLVEVALQGFIGALPTGNDAELAAVSEAKAAGVDVPVALAAAVRAKQRRKAA
jgi:hypothetical protein